MLQRTFEAIAFDMDGTLLNEEKQIDAETVQRMTEAAAAGKIMIIASGRPLSEVRPYFPVLRHALHYVVCENGAYGYDVRKRKLLWRNTFPPKVLKTILKEGRKRGAMLYGMLNGQGIAMTSDIPRMAEFHMGEFRELYEQTAVKKDNLYAYLHSRAAGLEKINYYCRSVEERADMTASILQLPVELVSAVGISLEISPRGIDKSVGLQRLCSLIGLRPEQLITVGDSDNDVTMLKMAGMGIAVGNGNENAKAAADTVVADHAHGGCAEAISCFLMGTGDHS